MALKDSSNMVKGRKPPDGLSRWTCIAFFIEGEMIRHILWVSMRSQYASCAHAGKSPRTQFSSKMAQALSVCFLEQFSSFREGTRDP